MRILIISGTGTVGSATVQQLRDQAIPVSVLTHSPESLKKLPAGVQGVVGDLRRPASIATALQGIDRLFVITPLSQTEAQEGLNAIHAAQRASVERIVLLSIHNVDLAPHIPHFRSKIEMEKALRETGVPFTVLMPNNFFQNDYWYQQALTKAGVYPQPYGNMGLSRVDVRDIAEAAAHALLEEGYVGQRFPLAGPEALTGEKTAEIWSRHLGRRVVYGGDDLDAWAEQASQSMPAWLVQDLKVMYALFQKHGLQASEEDLKQQQKILHHPPRGFDSFAAETARVWRTQAA